VNPLCERTAAQQGQRLKVTWHCGRPCGQALVQLASAQHVKQLLSKAERYGAASGMISLGGAMVWVKCWVGADRCVALLQGVDAGLARSTRLNYNCCQQWHAAQGVEACGWQHEAQLAFGLRLVLACLLACLLAVHAFAGGLCLPVFLLSEAHHPQVSYQVAFSFASVMTVRSTCKPHLPAGAA
jgi:hypothetical protein